MRIGVFQFFNMSQFSAADYDADRYNKSRPTYPVSFYEKLDSYYRTAETIRSLDSLGRSDNGQVLVDIGCGPGVATYQMYRYLPQISKLVGLDISDTMVQQANNLINDCNRKLSFQVSSYDNIDHLFGEETVDMVTCVQCSHWFDFTTLLQKSYDILKPNGVLAIWGYDNAIILEFPELDSLINYFQVGEQALGPYWDQPGRNILRSLLSEQKIDSKLFNNIEEHTLYANTLRDCSTPDTPLVMILSWTFRQYVQYLKTFSGYFSWKRSHPDDSDIIDEYVTKFIAKTNNKLTMDTQLTVAWNTYFKLATKQGAL